jgi:hypothetical protein
MTPSFPSRERISFASWRVLALLGFAIFINFVDRGNLSIAAPLLKDEQHDLTVKAMRVGSAYFVL